MSDILCFLKRAYFEIKHYFNWTIDYFLAPNNCEKGLWRCLNKGSQKKNTALFDFQADFTHL